MQKVMVVGAGPAGLTAAEHLLDERGDLQVDLLTLEPYLGGNASSWTTPDGRVVEQGQHIMAGFYREMTALLDRAGAGRDTTTDSNHGHMLIWEERDGRAHRLHLGPSAPGALLDGLMDYGLWDHVTVTSELATLPGLEGVAVGTGLLLCPLDGPWWRLGLTAFPELNLPLGATLAPGWQTGLLDTSLTLHTGLRLNWLAFWGLNVTGRLDRAFTLQGTAGWWEAGMGLAVRM